MGKLTSYLKDVRVELGKVNWPTREQTTTYTMLVIGVCLVVAIFLGGLDYVFSFLLNRFVF